MAWKAPRWRGPGRLRIAKLDQIGAKPSDPKQIGLEFKVQIATRQLRQIRCEAQEVQIVSPLHRFRHRAAPLIVDASQWHGIVLVVGRPHDRTSRNTAVSCGSGMPAAAT
jgi:hypothetical protein